ncbi:MAG: type III secretion system export apparatus subunit SctR [Thermoanaerobaculia bacterium]
MPPLPLAQVVPAQEGVAGQFGANPLVTLVVLALMAILPFLLMMTTSFLKFAVVLSILRSALGTQQIPPTPVIMGLALVMTIYVMAPVGSQIHTAVQEEMAQSTGDAVMSGSGSRAILQALGQAREPLRRFLEKHAHEPDVSLFLGYRRHMVPEEERQNIKRQDLMILLPAFAISELAEAFAIGFLIFLPFLVIDMVVSNILLAMGMFMLPPVIVSLPFKLLLFIMIDGWRLLTEGLLQPYVA